MSESSQIESSQIEIARYCQEWLDGEYAHSRIKFGSDQSVNLITPGVNARWGHDAASYWNDRMHKYDYSDTESSVRRKNCK